MARARSERPAASGQVVGEQQLVVLPRAGQLEGLAEVAASLDPKRDPGPHARPAPALFHQMDQDSLQHAPSPAISGGRKREEGASRFLGAGVSSPEPGGASPHFSFASLSGRGGLATFWWTQ